MSFFYLEQLCCMYCSAFWYISIGFFCLFVFSANDWSQTHFQHQRTISWCLTIKMDSWRGVALFLVLNLHILMYLCLNIHRYCLYILDQRACSFDILTGTFIFEQQCEKGFLTIYNNIYLCMLTHVLFHLSPTLAWELVILTFHGRGNWILGWVHDQDQAISNFSFLI